MTRPTIFHAAVVTLPFIIVLVNHVSLACFTDCASCAANGRTCYYCHEGYWLNNGNCQRCPTNCMTCSNNVTCYLCHQNYWNSRYKCDKQCPKNCLTGCYDSSGSCYSCKPGWYGLVCNYTCEYCFESACIDQSCIQCKTGYKQITDGGISYCESNCSANCIRCSTATHCEECTEGFFLDTVLNQCILEQRCSSNCKNGCSPSGKCIDGCKDGFAGLDCSLECNDGCAICSQSNKDVCLKCDGDYNTNTCIENITSTEISSLSGIETSKTTKAMIISLAGASTSAGAVAGGVGGGLVVIVTAVGLLILIMRKKRVLKPRTNLKSDLEAVVPSCSKDLEVLCSTPDHQKSAPTEDYVYAQPSKLKKQEANNSKTRRIYSNTKSCVASSTFGSQEVNTDDEANLEEVDDGDAAQIQHESEIPTSDTYYNTARLVRSRVQVSDLLYYIKNKTDFASEFEKLPKGLTRPCTEALKPSNRALNRYRGVYAYDATRVVLRSKIYINACYIEGENNAKAYIASLGPTEGTTENFASFWETVWQENTQKIVMLTNLVESAKNKCDKYWPNVDSSCQYGQIFVTCSSERIFSEFVLRNLEIRKGGKRRTVTQYHYTAWPDKSVPDTVVSLLEFRDTVERNSTNCGPAIVHCSAGIGRTGTYIALDMLIKQGREEQFADVFGCVTALRGQRVNMVQNVEQYTFLHHCVLMALTCNSEPLDIATLMDSLPEPKMAEHFQNYLSLPTMPNKEADTVAANKKRKYNRKEADIPGDLHRVKLRSVKEDYVNAVYIDGYVRPRQYIAAQTPMPNTVEDFLSVLCQEKVDSIICLDEKNLTDKTVAYYIPEANQTVKCGHYQISCVKYEPHRAFDIKEIKIIKGGHQPTGGNIIRHYQITGWTTGELTPDSRTDFLHLVTSVSKENRGSQGAVLVHCMNGAKRSGLFCAVSNMLEKLSVEKRLSVINTVCQVQARRRSALTDVEQFKFCLKCVQEYLENSEAKTYYNNL